MTRIFVQLVGWAERMRKEYQPTSELLHYNAIEGNGLFAFIQHNTYLFSRLVRLSSILPIISLELKKRFCSC